MTRIGFWKRNFLAFLSFLALLIQRSFSLSGRVPSNRKNAKVTPLQKPGKPPDSPDCYRPISILSPVARIAERDLLPEIQQATDLPKQQHGFRKVHSTVTAISNLVADVIDGFNERRPPRRTIAVALDLRKALDTVNPDQLIELILQSRLTDHTKKWLSNYLRARVQRTDLDGLLSKAAVIKTGVP